MTVLDISIENFRNHSKLRSKLESFDVGAVSVYLLPYPNDTGLVVPFRYLAQANTVVICHEAVMANAACREPISFYRMFGELFKSIGATTVPNHVQVSYADLCTHTDSELLFECSGWYADSLLCQAAVHLGAVDAPSIGGTAVAMYTRWKGYADTDDVSCFRGMLSDFASSVVRRKGVLPTTIKCADVHWKRVITGTARLNVDPPYPKPVYLTTHSTEDKFVVSVSSSQCHINHIGGLIKTTAKQIQAISTLAAIYVASLNAYYRGGTNQTLSYHIRRESGIVIAFVAEVDSELWACMKLNKSWGVKRITRNGDFVSNCRTLTVTIKP